MSSPESRSRMEEKILKAVAATTVQGSLQRLAAVQQEAQQLHQQSIRNLWGITFNAWTFVVVSTATVVAGVVTFSTAPWYLTALLAALAIVLALYARHMFRLRRSEEWVRHEALRITMNLTDDVRVRLINQL